MFQPTLYGVLRQSYKGVRDAPLFTHPLCYDTTLVGCSNLPCMGSSGSHTRVYVMPHYLHTLYAMIPPLWGVVTYPVWGPQAVFPPTLYGVLRQSYKGIRDAPLFTHPLCYDTTLVGCSNLPCMGSSGSHTRVYVMPHYLHTLYAMIPPL